MTDITLKAENDDGTALESVTARSVEKTEEIAGRMDHATVVLSRDNWETLDDAFDRVNDHLVVETDHPDLEDPLFTGRFDDETAGDGSVTVHVAGYERDAKDAEPTGDNVVYQNVDDSKIVQDLVDDVPTLSAGTIATLTNNLSMSFSHANPSKALADVEEATGGEIRYNFDRSVDYVARRGSDKPGIVLSPAEQTVVDDLEVTEDAREQVTHVRGFGAQNGPDQVTAEAVVDSYEAGDREIWREFENKDIVDESRLKSIVDRLVEEYDGEPRRVDVETSVPVTLDIDVGDSVTVTIPDENVDSMLRVLQRRSVLGSAGALLGLTLSNRLATRDDSAGQKGRKDLQRFNRGFGGLVTRDTAPYGAEACGDGNPRKIIVPNWPDDIVEEITVDLVVQGFAWRSPVTPESHNHSVSISSHTHDVTFTVPNHHHDIASIRRDTSTEEGHAHEYWEPDEATGTFNTSSDTETSDSGGSTTTTSGSTVGLSPEITETFGGNQYYPSSVDIKVNGTLIETLAGDDTGEWTETVDLTGELTSGDNTIEADPSTRGRINLITSVELFRRGRTGD